MGCDIVAEQTMNRWQATIRGRILIAAALFAAWSVAVEAQLVYLQVFKRAALQVRADEQRQRMTRVPAKRGDVVDCHQQVLATSVEAEAIAAVPSAIDDPAATASALCTVLSDCTARERDEIAKQISRRRQNGQKADFAWVRRANRVSAEDARRVAALSLPGIWFVKDTRRAYPNNELAAHLLGYVGTDNKGLNGIEAAYDKWISGREGSVLIEIDGGKHPFGRLGHDGTPGATLQLTIDQYLQHVAERELRAAVEENRAASGSVVIMNPYTGDVLALANEPTFNPNRFGEASLEQRRNRAIQDVYEPGSTFKIVTASAAIEEQVLTPDALVDVSGGQIRLGSRVVRDTHNYGVLSFTDVIVKSSNVGAIRIGLRLGSERLGRYVHRFGFGTQLSPDLAGENAGIVWDPARWSESALASVAMGYQISVTPLQMATAASAIANGGNLIQPRVVKAVISAQGVRTEVKPRVLRRAIEQSTADELTTMMEGVIERGTAKAARIPGFTIAGKTGTAHKLENGRYSSSDYNASFVGFLPSRKPVVTILVVIDSPHGSHGYFGGSVAAPAFKRIAETTMRYLGVAPNLAPAPVVFAQQHSGPRDDAPGATPRVTIVRTAATEVADSRVMPDLIGLNAREAIRVLARVGMTPRVNGDGIVVQQDPRPGSPVDRGTVCSLALGRPVSVVIGSDQHQ
jgi:cell division protein FtsI (penicillin-binding protein 3)